MSWREEQGPGPADDADGHCLACDGTGRVHTTEPERGLLRWQDCPSCGGTGRVTTDDTEPAE